MAARRRDCGNRGRGPEPVDSRVRLGWCRALRRALRLRARPIRRVRGVATAGVFIGGGIAPKLLSSLRSGSFIEAFRSKAPMTDLLSRMPVHVILNADAGLLGAAVFAQALDRG